MLMRCYHVIYEVSTGERGESLRSPSRFSQLASRKGTPTRERPKTQEQFLAPLARVALGRRPRQNRSKGFENCVALLSTEVIKQTIEYTTPTGQTKPHEPPGTWVSPFQ